MRLDLRVLGGFTLRVAGGRPIALPTRKSQALLAYLALQQGDGQTRDHLAALFWGDTPDAQARHSLRQALFDLRKALPRAKTDVLRADPGGIWLNPSAVGVDVVDFQRLVGEGTTRSLTRAVELYRGDLLAGFNLKEESWEEWVRAERMRLREIQLRALKAVLTRHTEAGITEAAIDAAARLLALDPLQEEVHRCLMRLYLQQGRRADALKQYQVCLDVLQRQLGVEPEAETRALYREIVPERATRPPRADDTPARVARMRRSRRADASPATPLIGRAPERDRLRRALKDALRGRGQFAAILGGAGIGKTRLMQDVADAALREGAHVAAGRCFETEQILPFGPWVDALRGALQGHDLESLDPVWRTELSRLLPELGRPDADAPASAHEARRLFEVVVRLVAFLAGRRPLVLLLDDLHWADEMTLRLLSFLGRRTRDHPVLIVGTARDDELDGVPVFRRALEEFDRDEQLVSLTLSPLTCGDTTELVRVLARVGGDDARLSSLSERIWRASEGNPFMVVETLRALQDGSEMPEPAELPLPHRVRQLISRRLERLGEAAQRLAGMAAVIGREFEFRLLHRIAGLTEEDTSQGVEELVRRQVLHGTGERFGFTHDRIREAVYGGLLAPTRRLLHGRVAGALEELYAADLAPHYVRLGTHLRAAEAWHRAASYFRRAGAEAYVRWGRREALACFEQALEALEHLPESRQTLETRIDLEIDLRRVHHFLADPRTAIEHLRVAERLARTLGDERRLGYVLNYLCIELQPLGRSAEAVEAGERALVLAEALGDFTLEIEARSHLGQACRARGDLQRARQLLERVVDALERDQAQERSGQTSRFAEARGTLFAGFPRSAHLSGARYALTRCLCDMGAFTEAAARVEAALGDLQSGQAPNTLAATLAWLGCAILCLARGDLHRAGVEFERALGIAERDDITPHVGAALTGLGYTQALLGHVDEGLALLEKAAELASRLRPDPTTLRMLGEIYLRAGEPDRALTAVERSLESARLSGERVPEARALFALAQIAACRRPLREESVEIHCSDALAIADECGMRPLVARCHLTLGELHSRQGRLDEACARLTTAAELFRSMDLATSAARAAAALTALERRRPVSAGGDQ